ncbi:MAG: MASE1 domain-containing protein [Microcoleus sp.]
MKLLNCRTRPLLQIGILALAYFVTGKLAGSILGIVTAEASPLWPPAGIALAALLLQGRRMWPGIALGSLLLNSTAGVGIPSTVIATSALSVTLQALAGEALLSRIGFSTKLDRLRDVLGLVAGAVIGSTFLGSTISNLSASIFGWVQWSNFLRNFWTMWLGDGMGILMVTPVLLTLSHLLPKAFCRKLITNYELRITNSRFPIPDSQFPIPDSQFPIPDSQFPIPNSRFPIPNSQFPIPDSQFPIPNSRFPIPNSRFPFLIVNYSEPLILLTLLLSVSWLVFCSQTVVAIALYPLEYLLFPLIVWAALRWSPPGAIFAYSIVSYIAIWGTLEGNGPFLVNTSATLSHRLTLMSVLPLQAFTGTIALVALILAATVAERQQALVEVRRTAAMLRDREASLANAQRIANLGNWDLDCDTLEPPDDWEESGEHYTSNIELRWSDELYRLLGFVPGTVKPTPEVFLQAVHPEDRELVARSHRLAMFEQKPYCIDYRIVLPDGKERTVCEQSAINSKVIAATVQDVTDRQRAANYEQAATDRDRLLSEMALRIRHSLDLQEILNTTVAEVRQFFKADRAFIGIKSAESAMPDSPVYGKIVAESVGTEWRSILGCVLADESLLEHFRTFYATNRARSVSDTAEVEVRACSSKYYSDYQIRATLNVPIVLGDELFGTLAVNQCSGPRQWQEFEIDLLEKLATQVAIALQQAQLLQQVKTLNANLESQVEERTRQLQQKMYELQESNRLKDLFLHAVSHKLRTPFMGMLILLKNLLNKSPSESQQTVPVARSILERIVEASEQQLGMLNALLDAHATEVKGIVLNTKPLDLHSFTSRIVADLAPIFEKNQATLIQQIPADFPQVNADLQQLQRVLENLLTNAVKHNPPGVNITLNAAVIEVEKVMISPGKTQVFRSNSSAFSNCIAHLHSPFCGQNKMWDTIREPPREEPIETSIKNQEMRAKFPLDRNCEVPRYQGQIANTGHQLPSGRSQAKMIRCTITDNGVGISKKQRESLFELYVEDPNSRQLTGLGLGLYLSKQIIKAHGGEIGVESTPGGGSTFWFSLPVMEVVSC